MRARSMSLSQLPTSQLGRRLHTLWGGIDPGDLRFSPGLLELLRYRRISNPEKGLYRLQVWRDLDVVPRGNSRRALVP